MSELTSCNHCTLDGIRYRAAKKDLRVTLLRGSRGGLDVYVHPANVEINREAVGSEENKTSPYWRAWLMALTDHCVC